VLSNVAEKTILWMFFCSRTALWTVNWHLVSEFLPPKSGCLSELNWIK
jgi:hypothetical protein